MADIVAEDNKTDTLVTSTRPLPRRKPAQRARIIVPIVILILLVGGYFAWKHFDAYESTDDAQIDGHVNAISARINGNVIEVLTDDERYVKAGDVLVRIDPRDYQVAVAKAEADLADAEAALQGSRVDIPITSIEYGQSIEDSPFGLAWTPNAAVAGAERQLDAAQARLDTAKAQVREAAANYKKDRRRCGALQAISRQRRDFPATIRHCRFDGRRRQSDARCAQRGGRRGRAEHQAPRKARWRKRSTKIPQADAIHSGCHDGAAAG